MIRNRNEEMYAANAMCHKIVMETKYGEEIRKCTERAEFYRCGKVDGLDKTVYGIPRMAVTDDDAVTSVMKGRNRKQCVLDFASYRHPGGGFMNGKMSQEEALCHASCLYNVLQNFGGYYDRNQKESNRCLYSDSAIYIDGVVFESDGDVTKCDVLVCASPNWSAAKRKGVSRKENDDALASRIRFIIDIIAVHNLERVVLGAFGCGVFGQDPKRVAYIFRQEIQRKFGDKKIEVVFAIPRGNGNYRRFDKIFRKY